LEPSTRAPGYNENTTRSSSMADGQDVFFRKMLQFWAVRTGIRDRGRRAQVLEAFLSARQVLESFLGLGGGGRRRDRRVRRWSALLTIARAPGSRRRWRRRRGSGPRWPAGFFFLCCASTWRPVTKIRAHVLWPFAGGCPAPAPRSRPPPGRRNAIPPGRGQPCRDRRPTFHGSLLADPRIHRSPCNRPLCPLTMPPSAWS